MCITVV